MKNVDKCHFDGIFFIRSEATFFILHFNLAVSGKSRIFAFS
jgi:hypothetical protein